MNECCLLCEHYAKDKCSLPALLCLNYDHFKRTPTVTVRKDDLETKYVSRQSFDEVKARAEVAEARVAELEALTRWIPVGERLPEKGVTVLTRNFMNFILTKEYHGDNGWCDENYDYWIGSDTITHWQPLPQPPDHFNRLGKMP